MLIIRRQILAVIALAFMVATTLPAEPITGPVWPTGPDRARIEYIGEIDLLALSPKGGFLSKLTRWIGGSAPSDEVTLPFDLLCAGNSIFMICQNIPALIEIDRQANQFRLHNYKKYPFVYPISICDGGNGTVFITDVEAKTVFRFSKGKVRPFITNDLNRPTGIAALPDRKRLYVVDTGDQSLKIYDYDGNLIKTVGGRTTDSEPLFNYPTFAETTNDGYLLVNDALNFEIKRFDSDGEFISAFGAEGDGPGAFSRPKGIAVDSEEHIYVVDNLFDNLQIFDRDGRVLLALGSAGDGPGQFWSPAGIDIASDTLFIADTYNNRIQILHYLKERP